MRPTVLDCNLSVYICSVSVKNLYTVHMCCILEADPELLTNNEECMNNPQYMYLRLCCVRFNYVCVNCPLSIMFWYVGAHDMYGIYIYIYMYISPDDSKVYDNTR